MLSQLSYAVRSLRACDISKLSLVPLILYLISVIMIYLCPGVMYFGENFDDICGVALRRKILYAI